MKLYFKIFILLLSTVAFAQDDLPILSTTSLANPDDDFNTADNGNYAQDTNNERDQYIGFWEYNQNGIIFQLKIEKVDKVLNKIEYNGIISSYNYIDKVILRYKLIKQGVVIYNNLNEPTIDYVTAWGTKQTSSPLVYGRFLDHTRNVVGSYTINKQLGTTTKIIFNLILGNYIMQNPPSYYQDGQPLFSIPTGGFEMTKIN